jgi:hypothetical protein
VSAKQLISPSAVQEEETRQWQSTGVEGKAKRSRLREHLERVQDPKTLVSDLLSAPDEPLVSQTF